MSDSVSSLAIAATSAVKAEGNSGSTAFTFTVTRTGATSQASAANWIVTGSGTNPALFADFVGRVLPSGTVSFVAGETSRIITVLVAGDFNLEGNEGFTVTLSAPSSGTIISTANANGIILDDEASISIAAAQSIKQEGHTGSTSYTFTVTRITGDPSALHSTAWIVTGSGANPAAASDFVGGILPQGTLTFSAGENSKTITVLIAGDNQFESNEEFTVTLSPPGNGIFIDSKSATGLIQNDDATLAIAASSASKNEGNSGSTAFTFTVTRTGDASVIQSANWTVVGSGLYQPGVTPATNSDFTGDVLPSGTVIFDVGQTSKLLTVLVVGDSVGESDEGFGVSLSAPSAGLTISTPYAEVRIVNDDSVATLGIAAASGFEGNSGSSAFSFTVTRTGDTSTAVSVGWSVSTGSSPYNDAATTYDFVGSVLPSGVITFAIGETNKIITGFVVGDNEIEKDEFFLYI